MENPEQKSTFEHVPWTLQQTFLGILLTLIPWAIFSFAISLSNSSTAAHPKSISFQQDLIGAIVVLFVAIVGEGFFVLAPLYFARKGRQISSDSHRSLLDVLGFRSFRVESALLWIVGLFIGFIVVNYLYQLLIMALHLSLKTNDQVILENGRIAPISTYVTLVAATFIAPFCEEIFFRSFAFMGFLREMRLSVAIVLSALLFAVAHADPASFVVLFFIGLALAVLRWRTASIWPGIILHLLNNGVSAVLVVLALHGVRIPF